MIDEPAYDRRDSDLDGGVAERVWQVGFWASLILVAFVAGALLTAANLFPGSAIARAYQGGQALYEKYVSSQSVYYSDLWSPERRPEMGVTAYRPGVAQEGLTLYTSGHEAAAYLVAMDGKVVHEWRRPFSKVWTKDFEVAAPQPDPFVFFREARLFPNGDLLVIYEAVGDTPYGYGIAKLDRDSNVIWTYKGHAHHNIDIGPDGRIYALTHGFSADRIKGFNNLADPRLDDYLVVLSPQGEELKKIRLIDLVAESSYQQLLHTVSFYAVGDALHTNNVDFVTEEEAARFPFAEPGDVLLSFRELGSIGVLNLEREAFTWMQRGPWIGQHDPDILPNGNVILFDNYGGYHGADGTSRVIEFDPRDQKVVWSYEGSAEAPLDSLIRSGQQRLPNGNTLITESSGGRIVEVTPEGEIAWEFLNPVRHRESPGAGLRIPIICWAQRIDPGTLQFTPTGMAAPQHPSTTETQS